MWICYRTTILLKPHLSLPQCSFSNVIFRSSAVIFHNKKFNNPEPLISCEYEHSCPRLISSFEPSPEWCWWRQGRRGWGSQTQGKARGRDCWLCSQCDSHFLCWILVMKRYDGPAVKHAVLCFTQLCQQCICCKIKAQYFISSLNC